MTTTYLESTPGGTRASAPAGNATRQSADSDVLTLSDVRRTYRSGGRRNPITMMRSHGAAFEAVKGVDLRVRRGELFALLGTNGAGKTSTVELVEGLARPTEGSIRVFGLDPVEDRAAVRARMGVVLQDSGFPSSLTVGEIAQMWQGTLSRPRPVEDALNDVDLLAKHDVVVQNLSGGERRRLDIALALMGNPELLVLDEPTTGLDPESRRQIWKVLSALLDDGCTILLTTHYLEEAEQLADHVAIMHDGRIAVEGTVAEIVADTPASITFTLPGAGGESALDIASLQVAGAAVHLGDEGLVTVETANLQPALAAVLAWAGEIVLPGLTARSASLQQVFLSIADNEESS